ncbi:MAG TPA: hypothetical protein VMU95_28085 [Trebonia sp.]|nr:hypothetical protein [Trebonia sp.]
MTNRREPRSGCISRLVRGRRFDNNPLRRPSDRAETWIMAGLLAVFLVGAPFAVLAGGGFANGLARHVQQEQRATEREVTATTTQPAVAPTTSYGQAYVPVKAQWKAPNGKTVTGYIPVILGVSAGTKQQLWTTLGGRIAAPPLRGSQVSDLTTIGRGAAVAALLVALAGGRAAARFELNRRRFAAWDADWLAANAHSSRRR